jgi:phage anti-repressor protein
MTTQKTKPETVDFAQLIKSSECGGLTLDFRSKLADRIKMEFTEEEQTWFIANFYVYLQYHSTRDFPIKLENVFGMIGFAHKKNAKRTLENNFVEGEDYTVTVLPTEHGKFAEEEILLNVDTFKNLCMITKTEKSKRIRKYYIKLEGLFNNLMNEQRQEFEQKMKLLEFERQEQEKQLEEKEKMIKLLENKPETEGFLNIPGYIYLAKDSSKFGHYKIGMTENPDKRLIGLNSGSSTNSIEIIKLYKTKNMILSEKIIHSVFYYHKIKKQKEWFYLSCEKLLNYIILAIKNSIDFAEMYIFKSIDEELASLNRECFPLHTPGESSNSTKKLINREIQTDIEAINSKPNGDSSSSDEKLFNKFLDESCVFDDLAYCCKKDLLYQYKIWSKINSIFNYRDFEQYIKSNFKMKKMLNPTFNVEMISIRGIKLKDSFYKFEFKEPHGEFEQFLVESCVKLPTGKLNRSTIKDTYEKWCEKNGKPIPSNKKISSLCNVLNKHFFKDKFFQDDSSYHGWFGISIKENILKGTGLASSICKKNKIYKVFKDEPEKIVKEWDSQKEAGEEFGLNTSTIKYRLDRKYIFNNEYDRPFLLVRESEFNK